MEISKNRNFHMKNKEDYALQITLYINIGIKHRQFMVEKCYNSIVYHFFSNGIV